MLMILTVVLFTGCGLCVGALVWAESRGIRISAEKPLYEKSTLFRGELYEELITILENAEEKTAEQKGIMRGYQEGNTNLMYVLVFPESGEIFSNSREYQKADKYSEYLQKFREQEWYIIISDSFEKCEGEDAGLLPDFHRMLMDNIQKEFIYAVSVDTAFPIKDTLGAGYLEYQKAAVYIQPCLIGTVLTVAGGILCLILLTLGAGRKPGEEKLYMNWFDRWYTEFAAGLVFCFWITGILIVVEEFMPYHIDIEEVFAIAFCGFYTSVWFLIGYLSLVKRIKAKNLWKRSFLYVSICFLKTSTGTGIRYSSGFLKKGYHAGKKGFSVGWRFLRESYLDQMNDLVKLCFLAVLYWLLRLLLSISVSGGNGISFFFLFLLDILTIGGILFYAASDLRIQKALKKIAEGALETKIDENHLLGYQKDMAESVNQIGEGMQKAIQESIRGERMKTELITNVSHDIKTPLTSIINYVDLLKREEIEDPKIQGYLEILEQKSQRLKTLTEDIVEASRASTGNVTLEMAELDFVELLQQIFGEYEERLKEQRLIPVLVLPEKPVQIYADGRRMWRILSNLFGNVVKYSLEGTRVYVNLEVREEKAELILKNISRDSLNISADELTERFVRGDQSRTTEGSGLGLSIAKSFTELMGGSFLLSLDGDLFKVTIAFPLKQ